MYVVCVTVRVKPDHVDEFIAATRRNAENTRKEPHNLRFDVLQAIDTLTQFVLYEVYDSEEGFKAHQQTEHYLAWKATVAEWMAEPRTSVKCKSLFPTDKSAW